MTLSQRVAQLLWCGWTPSVDPGIAPAADPHLRCLLEELAVGGIIFFFRNVGTSTEVAALTASILESTSSPPLLAIDQEGGRVSRLPYPGLVFPGAMALGAIDDQATTRSVFRAIGDQLASLGFAVNFAPSLDVNNNPANPVIGTRSFGEDPDLVARHGVAALRGLLDGGVQPVVKHFPGHGDTAVDSHLALPVQTAPRERLESVELPPFRAAIAAGAPMVMSSHIRFPALDPDLPATLSPRILTGLLREELAFEGAILTDCMEMRGITDHWTPESAAVLAVRAGADVLLVSHSLDVQRRMHQALRAAVEDGTLPESRIEASLQRIATLRERAAPVLSHRPDGRQVGAEPYRFLESRTAEAALTLVGRTPLPQLLRDRPVTVSGAREAAHRLRASLAELGYDCSGADFPEALSETAQPVIVAAPREPFADDRPPHSLYRHLARHPHAVVIAAGEPYLLAHYPAEVARLAAWGSQPVHLRAVARCLSGDITPGGRLPVTVG